MPDEILSILQANKMADLKRFLSNRQCLNTSNIYFTYLFYVVQMVGLLTTSVAQSYGLTNIVWLGIGLNSLATLIHTFEQTNNKLSKHMLDNILSIKNGTYVDEGILIDLDDDDKKCVVPAALVPAAPTPVPATPVPATPVPATPVPATPVPATPVPVPAVLVPAPAVLVPATLVPAPAALVPVPAALVPVPAALVPVPATLVPAVALLTP
jgi:hypothetical protein